MREIVPFWRAMLEVLFQFGYETENFSIPLSVLDAVLDEIIIWKIAVVTGKQQNNSLSKTEVWSFRKWVFFIAARDAQGIALPKCACRKDTTTSFLCCVNIHIHYISEKCLSYSYFFPENLLAYVNVLHAHLLAPLGGCRGSSDEGWYSSSRCPLVYLCFCANSVLRWHIPCVFRCCFVLVLWSSCSFLISVVCTSALPSRDT